MLQSVTIKYFFLTVFLSFTAVHFSYSQCHHDHAQEKLYEQIPALKSKMENINEFVRIQNKFKQQAKTTSEQELVIPVVVHVIHKSSTLVGTDENLSDSTIQAVINNVNDAFSHTSGLSFTNPFSGVDLNIRLCLAIRDTAGQETTGIIRHADDVLTITNEDNNITQETYNWDPSQYLNFYLVSDIVSDESSPVSSGTLGYAYLPSAHGLGFDGAVFIASENTFWHGLVTHEVGHYLGLTHTFTGGCQNDDCTIDGDMVCDTPPKKDPGGASFDCSNSDDCHADDDDQSANNPFRPTNLGGIGNIEDSNENYMDYSGSCWQAFTEGQKDRMRTILLSTRASLFESDACTPFEENDLAITSILFPEGNICSSILEPEIEIQNDGSDTITTATIHVKVNNILQYEYTFTGELRTGNSTVVKLNNTTFSEGENELHVYVNTVNGVDDEKMSNDTITIFNSLHTISDFPYEEGFEESFDDINWSLYNPEEDKTWEINDEASAYDTGEHSIVIDNFTSDLSFSENDWLITPVLNLTSHIDPLVSFDVAYAPYGPSNYEGLAIYISEDCGTSWNEVYLKENLELATSDINVSSFTPDSSEWRNDTFDISAYAGKQIKIGFENHPGWGNRLFIDNFTISASSNQPLTTQIEENKDILSCQLHPNPSDHNTTLELYNTVNQESIDVTIYDAMGQVAQTYHFISDGGLQAFELTSSSLSKGTYLITIHTPHSKITKKLIKM